MLDAGRIGIAALAVGLAQGAYEAARHYAFVRTQFGQKIGTFQSIRARLVDTAARIEAARLLTYRAAALKDAGARTTLEAAMAKLYSSEIAVRAAEDGVQIHGGYGFVKDYPAEKFFRDVKLTTIGEGTSEIQRLVIARQLHGGLTATPVAAPPDALAATRARRRRARGGARDLACRGRRGGRRRRCRARSASIFARTGRAFLVGVTGVPGGGKSTLVDQLIVDHPCAPDCTVGVLAVDPTSPFSGGAVLGDRVRMGAPRRRIAGVFVRSMATRGHLGGLARDDRRRGARARRGRLRRRCSSRPSGVGQDEVDVARTADATVVVLVPGTGDDVQAMKAGIMEIADVFVVNKADREGIDRLVQSIEAALSLQPAASGRRGRRRCSRPRRRPAAASTSCGPRSQRFRARPDSAGHGAPPLRYRERVRQLVGDVLLARLERALPPERVRADRSRTSRAARRRSRMRQRTPWSPARPRPRTGSRMKAVLDHVGIAVERLDEALAFYRDALGLEVERPEEVTTQRVRAHLLDTGGVGARTARSHGRRLADRRLPDPARPRPASHHAARGRPARGAGAADGAATSG